MTAAGDRWRGGVLYDAGNGYRFQQKVDMTRAARPTFAVLGLAALLAGCGSSSSEPAGSASASSSSGTSAADTVSIVASTDVYGDIAKTIAGDGVTVTSIISDPSADPHSYEANTRTQLELSRAAIVIENGGGYDDFVDTMLKASASKATVINAVDLSGKEAAAGAELNEHVWYDFPTVQKVADAIEAALAKASPAKASTFAANGKAFDAQLAALEQQEADAKAMTQGKGVAITEPVPGYLLDALGADDKTPEEFSEAIEEETDVAPDVLAETLALFSAKQVQALVYNEQTTGAQTEQVLKAAQDNGIAVVPVTETLPEGKSYQQWMSDNVTAVVTALSK